MSRSFTNKTGAQARAHHIISHIITHHITYEETEQGWMSQMDGARIPHPLCFVLCPCPSPFSLSSSPIPGDNACERGKGRMQIIRLYPNRRSRCATVVPRYDPPLYSQPPPPGRQGAKAESSFPVDERTHWIHWIGTQHLRNLFLTNRREADGRGEKMCWIGRRAGERNYHRELIDSWGLKGEGGVCRKRGCGSDLCPSHGNRKILPLL